MSYQLPLSLNINSLLKLLHLQTSHEVHALLKCHLAVLGECVLDERLEVLALLSLIYLV